MRILTGVMILLLAFWGQLALAAFGAPTAEPVFIATGKFAGTDDVHKGEGRAVIVQLANGQRFLRFEEFKVTNGPVLYGSLSGHSSPRNRAQLHDGGAFEVGLLKGNIGNQNYELPANVDPAKYRSVVIYCKRFSVLFASAELIFNR